MPRRRAWLDTGRDEGKKVNPMIRRVVVCWSGSWRRTLLIALVSVAPALLALSTVGAASATAAPKGEFEPFKDCPLSDPELQACLIAKTESGEITIGKEAVPIKNTQTLQGGFEEEESGALKFVGAADGNTLSKTPQTVPGGLLGQLCEVLPPFLKTICDEFFSKGLTEVKATTELAAPASAIGLNEENLLTESGVALKLPVKVKLENAFLGSSCYVGSNAEPIVLDLTTGTTSPPPPNKPIKGKVGRLENNPEGNILTIENNTLVDNAFASPGAQGCDGIFSFLVDPALDAVLGIPSPAGHNTAILNNTLKQASAGAVREHE
jgi:hypothetical protein